MTLDSIDTTDLLAELTRRRKLAEARLGAGRPAAESRTLRGKVPMIQVQGKEAPQGCVELCRRLIKIAAPAYGVKAVEVAMLKGRTPHALRASEARWLVCHVLRLTGWSFPLLAAAFRVNHGSVIKGIERLTHLMDSGESPLALSVFEKLCAAVEND